jgi:hypothetical protein
MLKLVDKTLVESGRGSQRRNTTLKSSASKDAKLHCTTKFLINHLCHHHLTITSSTTQIIHLHLKLTPSSHHYHRWVPYIPKAQLAEHLQLAPWPLNYRAVTPPKYHGNTDPRKFLMCYEAAIASAGGDEATLAKSLIISLEDATANWYSRLPPSCIYSWQQLKDKILLNFQGFQPELDTKEDFLSCVQKEREPLPEFYRRFLQLKAQAPDVFDEQVMAQAIKTLRTGPLHSHLVR